MESKIFELIKNNDLEGIRELLRNEPSIIKTTNEHSITPLLYSLYLNKKEAAELIYGSGGTFTIHECTGMNDLNAVKKIADENAQSVNELNREGWTALHLAAFWGHLSIAELLLEHGAAIDAPSKSPTAFGNSPLQAAISMNQIEMVEYLIQKGADVNFIQYPSVNTPLHIAASRNNEKILKMLLEKGARKDVKTNDRKSPLDIAIERKCNIAIQLLQ